ncbi:glucosyltransferase domain-containing protein [Hyphomonas sp. WL0036]|uniref:glucosyltransferase domain-containing protein n=1 Tax=Hyphomonas sediminis TaxID=2866160 RepID=UPI001C80C42B|nr:glucosyltransferase domain-containing protein [Hyphomonas sediminis]MBY9068549.1 glucosyltransferase domain-containing protein [Hyphomonas sediminis]
MMSVREQIAQIFSDERKSPLLWAIGIAVFAYFIFIAQHPLGNHALRLPWLHENEQIGNGRWLGTFFGHLHYDADVPVVMPAFSIALGALAALIASHIWRLGRTRLDSFIVFAIVLVFPMNLAYFYYSFMAPLFFVAHLFAVLAVFVMDRWSIWRIAAGALLVLLTLASYQASISLFGILTFTAPIASFLLTRGNPDNVEIRAQCIILTARVIGAALGGVGYLLSLKYFKVGSSQSLNFDSISDAIERVRYVSVSAFEHLWITQPDMLAPLKISLLIALTAAIALSAVVLWRSPLKAVITIGLWIGAIISSKAIFLISDPTGSIFEYRYNGALAYLHAFSFAVLLFLFWRPGVLRFCIVGATGVLIMTMVQADLVRQSVLTRGEAHDLAIANRVLARIEQLDTFDPNRTYDLIRIGRYSSFRYKLMTAGGWKVDRAGDGHMDYGEVTDRWVDEDAFRLVGARIKFQQSSSDPRYSAKYAEISQSSILDGREPWPAPSSVFISGDRIIVLMENPKATKTVEGTPVEFVEGGSLNLTPLPDRWRSIGGGPPSIRVTPEGLDFSSGQGGISVEALDVSPGESFILTYAGKILDAGNNGVPLSFAVGPVFLDADGKVVGWWSSEAGRKAVAQANADGTFSFERAVVAPDSATSAHLGFHGPYSPDGKANNGRIRINSAALIRNTDSAD